MKRVQVYLTESIYEAARAIAYAQHLSMAQVIRSTLQLEFNTYTQTATLPSGQRLLFKPLKQDSKDKLARAIDDMMIGMPKYEGYI